MFRKLQQGDSLLEVMVSVVIFSIVLLAYIKTQFSALQSARQTYWQSIALTQTMAMSERLQANPHAIAAEISRWNQENAQLLPQGIGYVQSNAGWQHIQLNWQSGNPQNSQELNHASLDIRIY